MFIALSCSIFFPLIWIILSARKPVSSGLFCHTWLNNQSITSCHKTQSQNHIVHPAGQTPPQLWCSTQQQLEPLKLQQHSNEDKKPRDGVWVLWSEWFISGHTRSGTEEQGTKPVAPHGSEQKGEQGFYSEQSASGSTKESPGPGSSSPDMTKVARKHNTVLHPAARCCVFSRVCAVTWSKTRGGSLPSGIFCWCCLVVLYRKTTMNQKWETKKDYKDYKWTFPFTGVPRYIFISVNIFRKKS